MAHIVRRCTSGKAQALLNDLVENAAHPDNYQDSAEYRRDKTLAQELSRWLLTETKREAKVDE